METLVVIAGAAVFAFGWGSDFIESVRRYWYGADEGNKLFRLPDGRLDKKRAVLITSAAHGAGCFAVYVLGETFKGPTQDYNVGLCGVGAWLAGAGLLHYFAMYRNNAPKNEGRRRKQMSLRASIKGFIGRPDDLNIMVYAQSAGQMYLEKLPWIKGTSMESLKAALLEWAALPDSDLERVWHDTAYHPKDV